MNFKASLSVVVIIAIAVFGITLFFTKAWTMRGQPTIAVKGDCAAMDNGGTLRLEGEGFTPHKPYLTAVKLNGENYLVTWGYADAWGETSSWKWTCDTDSPPGKYTVVLFDRTKQRTSNKVTFEVKQTDESKQQVQGQPS